MDEVIETAPAFAPLTLKQILTGVMDLGRRAGRLGETMALLGHQEAEFRRLREEIGIPRAAPPSSLVPAAVLVKTAEGWMAPGGWVPDILDRVAGRDVLGESGAPPRPFRLEELECAGADHIFIQLEKSGFRASLEEVLAASGLPPEKVHGIKPDNTWLEPTPLLPRVIFEAASRLHGFSAVLSEQE